VQNVGLMAQKAEEYGSHPTTFEIPAAGTVRMILDDGDVLHEHKVERATSGAPPPPTRPDRGLGAPRHRPAEGEGCEAIFWLDETRAHDAELIAYVKPILEAKGVADSSRSWPRARRPRDAGDDHEGRELHRDHRQRAARLPDRPVPDPRLATSAKMLSIVKLMNGGGLFETGAGGSAPKHVQAAACREPPALGLLGEFCALGESFKFLAEAKGNAKARCARRGGRGGHAGLSRQRHAPQRKPGQPDNRNSHYWFARYWAEALAAQTEDAALAAHFAPIAKAMAENEDQITAELMAEPRASRPIIGGYYHPDPA
jgi:isocitrate dehydrogenase